ncbi:hypothetical protein NW070_03015 [Mycoplasmopsis cynos]|nr:hypothetical protein [Mycoplasmopsis cynos]UWV77836.1 hypothetical protein NW070_03015 [Mycoplasmopsis cynos]
MVHQGQFLIIAPRIKPSIQANSLLFSKICKNKTNPRLIKIKAILTIQNKTAIVNVPKSGINKMFLIPCNDFGNFPKIYFENTITIAAAKNAPKIPPINPDPVPKNLSGSATPELAIAFFKNPYDPLNVPLDIAPTTNPVTILVYPQVKKQYKLPKSEQQN